ncbi:MAG TPA: KpsF/GutQ family sugar-phosphate isomerase [Gammaproteobacteria bacterium]|nr:KpsF/GutQ family sugar-phosphate isomerase [Gammaproteobacteria bacterium]
MTSTHYKKFGQAVINIEAEAIHALNDRIDENFTKACETLLQCSERVIVMGMGKSSYIGGKIAATLASTGTPAFFVHPGEASHGDLGMITQKDVVIAISNSGETPEILTLLPLIKHLNVPLISITGNTQSTLSKAAEVNLDVSIKEEACPLGLAPTSSTTAALVMGDALAITLLQARGFTAVDFARSHPGGRLGKRLLLKVSDLMKTGDALPIVKSTVTVSEALKEMSQKTLGMTTVVDSSNKLLGIYTDGDLRRTLDKNLDIRTTLVQDVITKNPKVINADKLAVEALKIMEDFRITALVIVDEHHHPIGVIHMHDLLKAGVA